MRKFINPFTDFGFHRIFGQEVHKELLIDFLNQLLIGERQIVDIRFHNPIQQPETQKARGLIFDVHCRDEQGGWFVVEMQNSSQHYFYDRGLFYLSRVISNQGEQGREWQFDLCPVYGIFLLNCTMGENSKFRTDVILADRETGLLFSDKLRQVYLELPRFTKEAEECETDFERWLYLLKNMETLDRMPFKARKAVFDKLLEVADIAALTKEERMAYDEALKQYRDYKNTIDYAEERGIEKGLIIAAQKMKAQNFPVSVIAQTLGLPPEEIEKL